MSDFSVQISDRPIFQMKAIIELGQERRGILKDIKYLTPTRSTIEYELPLAEVITDFFDQLKSRTKGYASVSENNFGRKCNNLSNTYHTLLTFTWLSYAIDGIQHH